MKAMFTVRARAAAAILAALALLLTACPNPASDGGVDTAQKPVFSVAPGPYTSVQTVGISTASAGASIRYTVDGSAPTASTGILYEGPVTVAATTTLKAVAYGDSYATSSIATGTWTINLTDASPPMVSQMGGTFANALEITLTSSTIGARIYYTTNGDEASDTTGTLYEAPITIDSACTLKAIAYKEGLDPSIPVVWVYAFRVADIATSVAAGTYQAEQSVELTSPTQGASIWYTTDGSIPAAGSGTSTLYSGAVTVDRSLTLKAIGVKAGYQKTIATLSAAYTLKVPTPMAGLGAGTFDYPPTTMFDPIPGASIRYTLDGSTPTTTTGTLYDGAAEIDGGVKLKLRAIAYRAGWTTSDVSVARDYTVRFPSTRTFRAVRATDNGWYNAAATRKAEGAYCVVYVENTAPVTSATAAAIAAEYDTNIHDMIMENFGAPSDVDMNGKVVLFLLDIIDGYAGSGGYVAGYFDPTHEFLKSVYANSNETDMLFLDVGPSVPGSVGFYQTAAHEMQHLVDFAQTYLAGRAEKDVWINEGLSSAAEYLYLGEQVQERIDWYNADAIGSIALGNNFLVWNGYYETEVPDAVLDNYSTAYLFFQWLRIHASNGAGIYKDILNSTSSGAQAVSSAAGLRIASTLSYWSDVLREWQLANLLQTPSGTTGYLGELALTAHMMDDPGVSWPLSPGESVFEATSGGTFSPSGSSGLYIRLVGVTLATGALDFLSPYTGDVILALNSNSNPGGADEVAYLPAWSGPTPSLLLSKSGPTPSLPSSWPVGILLAPGGSYHSGSVAPSIGRPINKLRSSLRALP